MINLLCHYLFEIRYADTFEASNRKFINGFKSGVSDCVIIVLLILWLIK